MFPPLHIKKNPQSPMHHLRKTACVHTCECVQRAGGWCVFTSTSHLHCIKNKRSVWFFNTRTKNTLWFYSSFLGKEHTCLCFSFNRWSTSFQIAKHTWWVCSSFKHLQVLLKILHSFQFHTSNNVSFLGLLMFCNVTFSEDLLLYNCVGT